MSTLTRFRRTGPNRHPHLPRGLAAPLLAAALLAAGTTQAADKPAAANVELSATVSKMVRNDQMIVQLATEQRGQSIEALNSSVLKTINDALEQAKRQRGVKARAGNISTSAEWNKDGERNGWQVRGTLMLEGSDIAAVSKLAGELATRLQLESVGYRLSEARRHEEENKLLQSAANAFKTRALATTIAFGYDNYVIKTLNIATNPRHQDHNQPYPMMLEAKAASAARAPSLPTESGESTVSLTARGTVELRR
ncbi:MAG: SIMPL domain-containing protein [Lautropia sp.]|nr:SIMPL domain-containing protein [Lautropia sp.]